MDVVDHIARAEAAAGALFVDGDGQVLIVEPTYKPRWEIPGGAVERGETPRAACERELQTGLGLDLPVGRLLVVDVSGRPYTVHTGEPEVMAGFVVGGHYPTVLNRHVFESLAFHGHLGLHVRVLAGRDPHHITEAEFKAIARALRAATERDDRITGIPSTKGAL